MQFGPTEMKEKEAELLVQSVTDFAIYNSLIGLAMVVFSYLSIVAFNYSALRQV